ncbi:MAG TPA: hypothetical protein VGC90_00415 [Candidatus Limnocylindrales bacterium]
MKRTTTERATRDARVALVEATLRRVGASQARMAASWSVLEAAQHRVHRNRAAEATAEALALPAAVRHA